MNLNMATFLLPFLSLPLFFFNSNYNIDGLNTKYLSVCVALVQNILNHWPHILRELCIEVKFKFCLTQQCKKISSNSINSSSSSSSSKLCHWQTTKIIYKHIIQSPWPYLRPFGINNSPINMPTNYAIKKTFFCFDTHTHYIEKYIRTMRYDYKVSIFTNKMVHWESIQNCGLWPLGNNHHHRVCVQKIIVFIGGLVS